MIPRTYKKTASRRALVVLVLLAVAAVVSIAVVVLILSRPTSSGIPTAVGGIQLVSRAFSNGSSVPIQYTCDGNNVSPPLSWTVSRNGSRSYALVMDDLDTPNRFIHWILFNIPSNLSALEEHIPKQGSVVGTGLQGKNDFGLVGYDGPCPPSGNPHRYRITLYALDATIGLPAGSTADELFGAMQGHILATGQLVGQYRR